MYNHTNYKTFPSLSLNSLSNKISLKFSLDDLSLKYETIKKMKFIYGEYTTEKIIIIFQKQYSRTRNNFVKFNNNKKYKNINENILTYDFTYEEGCFLTNYLIKNNSINKETKIIYYFEPLQIKETFSTLTFEFYPFSNTNKTYPCLNSTYFYKPINKKEILFNISRLNCYTPNTGYRFYSFLDFPFIYVNKEYDYNYRNIKNNIFNSPEKSQYIMFSRDYDVNKYLQTQTLKQGQHVYFNVLVDNSEYAILLENSTNLNYIYNICNATPTVLRYEDSSIKYLSSFTDRIKEARNLICRGKTKNIKYLL